MAYFEFSYFENGHQTIPF